MFKSLSKSRRIRYLIYVIVVSAVAFALDLPSWIRNAWEHRQYYGLREQVKKTISMQAQFPPAELDQRSWEQGVVISTNTVFGNIFFTPKDATYTELASFARDLDETRHLQSVGRIRWIWLRLESVKSKTTAIKLKNTRLVMGDLATYTLPPATPDQSEVSPPKTD